jgi:hypothetical protein
MTKRRALGIPLAALAVALVASAAFASAASAEPFWKFGGTQLVGTETVSAKTTSSSLKLNGLATTCEATAELTIENTPVQGVATVNALELKGCGTDGVCTVQKASVVGLPWSANTTSFGGKSFVVTDDFDERFLYGNELCAIEGWTLKYSGTAAGVFNNATSTLEYDGTTGSNITTFGGGTKATYEAKFKVEATGARKGQTLTLS